MKFKKIMLTLNRSGVTVDLSPIFCYYAVMSKFVVIIFYKYTPIENPVGFMNYLRQSCQEIGIFGRILIANEGINGTVEGTVEQIEAFAKAMHSQDGSAGTFGDFSDVWFKESEGTGGAFLKLKIKVKPALLQIGADKNQDINPNVVTGKHIEPSELKAWIDAGEKFEIIDMRNDYEYAVGHFKGSIESSMTNFTDLPKVMPKLESLKKKKVLTVCTYGIRCEKASGYLIEQGFEDVYQLNGGIGTYMKAYPGQDFLGSLYVFDERMTEQFTNDYVKIGVCHGCGTSSEKFGNCALIDCHKQWIICSNCNPAEVFCNDNCKAASE